MPRKNATTTRGKPFAPGNAGRPVGARHRVTRAAEALLDGQAEALTQVAIEKALGGDSVALRLCLERLVPPRRDSPITITLPSVTTAGDTVAASSSLLAALAVGDITPEEAGRVMALLTAHKAIVETGDLDARLIALEQRSMRKD